MLAMLKALNKGRTKRCHAYVCIYVCRRHVSFFVSLPGFLFCAASGVFRDIVHTGGHGGGARRFAYSANQKLPARETEVGTCICPRRVCVRQVLVPGDVCSGTSYRKLAFNPLNFKLQLRLQLWLLFLSMDGWVGLLYEGFWTCCMRVLCAHYLALMFFVVLFHGWWRERGTAGQRANCLVFFVLFCLWFFVCFVFVVTRSLGGVWRSTPFCSSSLSCPGFDFLMWVPILVLLIV